MHDLGRSLASPTSRSNKTKSASHYRRSVAELKEFIMRPMITRRGALVAVATSMMLAAAVLPGSAQTAPPASTQPNVVSIDNFTFTPQTLTVKAGTTVTWTNKDDIPHGIASDKNAFARSRALDTDDSYSVTFSTPGIYKYFCYIHPHMTGAIVVEPGNG
jgi:plastocyanin